MKHQVFLFVLIFSLSIDAMDINLKVIKIIERCCLYNQYRPHTYNIEQLEKDTREVLKLPDAEQKKILKQTLRLVPKLIQEDDQCVIFDWKISDEENELTGTHIFY
jgi:hypothetical protein